MLVALGLLAWELCNAIDAAAWSISATTDDFAGIRTIQGIESALDPKSGRARRARRRVVYRLADYPATAQALAHGCAFVAGSTWTARTLPRSRSWAISATSAARVGRFDGERGYLLEIYSDGDHAELAVIEPCPRARPLLRAGGHRTEPIPQPAAVRLPIAGSRRPNRLRRTAPRRVAPTVRRDRPRVLAVEVAEMLRRVRSVIKRGPRSPRTVAVRSGAAGSGGGSTGGVARCRWVSSRSSSAS